jgi:hypothetical protein
MFEPDKLIKKWSTLLNSTNNATAMLIEHMKMKIKMTKFPTDKQLDDLWDEIGSYFNLYDEVRDTIREALNLWGTPEPIALEDREPEPSDLDEENCCWWWDNTDDVWERICGDAGGIASLKAYSKRSWRNYTHWLPHWAIKQPQEKE